MDGVAPREQMPKRFGQRFPGRRLAHPNGVAAIGRNGLCREDRARRRSLQKAEIRVPVATKYAALLIRLLENPNDLRFALQRLHVGQAHQRPEGARKGLELIEREVLISQEQYLMAGERVPEQCCQVI